MRSSYRTTLSVFFLKIFHNAFSSCCLWWSLVIILIILDLRWQIWRRHSRAFWTTHWKICLKKFRPGWEPAEVWTEKWIERVWQCKGKNPCHVDLISSCSVVLWGFSGKSQVLRLRRSLSSVRMLMHRKIRFVKFKKTVVVRSNRNFKTTYRWHGKQGKWNRQ